MFRSIVNGMVMALVYGAVIGGLGILPLWMLASLAGI